MATRGDIDKEHLGRQDNRWSAAVHRRSAAACVGGVCGNELCQIDFLFNTTTGDEIKLHDKFIPYDDSTSTPTVV